MTHINISRNNKKVESSCVQEQILGIKKNSPQGGKKRNFQGFRHIPLPTGGGEGTSLKRGRGGARKKIPARVGRKSKE